MDKKVLDKLFSAIDEIVNKGNDGRTWKETADEIKEYAKETENDIYLEEFTSWFD